MAIVVFLAGSAQAQLPSDERIAQLIAAFPALTEKENANKSGYARDPFVRKEIGSRQAELAYTKSLNRVAISEQFGADAESSVERNKQRVEQRQGELARSEQALQAAENFLKRLEQTLPPDDPKRDQKLEDARAAIAQAELTRSAAGQALSLAKTQLAAAEATASAAKQRLTEALSAEEEARANRERSIINKTPPTCSVAGMPIQRNTIIVRFRDSASVDDISRTLARHRLTVRAGIPEISMFIVEIPSIPLEPDILHVLRLRRIIATLRLEPSVFSAVQQATIGGTTVPKPSSLVNPDLCWSWYDKDCVSTAGAKTMRFPEAWNFSGGIRRRGDTAVPVAILDEGFTEHEDLTFKLVCSATRKFHGNEVMGVLASDSTNGKGMDGATPFAAIEACAPDFVPLLCETDDAIAFTSFTLALRSLLVQQKPRIINVSLGYNWIVNFGDRCAPSHRKDIRELVEAQGSTVRDLVSRFPGVIIVSAAGNDCLFDRKCKETAMFTSPFNWAALAPSIAPLFTPASANVFVVASTDGSGRLSTSSNKDAPLAAPGEDILCPTDIKDGYTLCDGTSIASPMVSGTVALMLAYNPALTVCEIRSILGIGRRRQQIHINAYEALVRSRKNALVDLADLNGDGKVDMADFEIFRRALKQTETHVFKEDLNGDGLMNENDQFFPRADLNGDGLLSRSKKSRVPGFRHKMTDLQIMQAVWSDPVVEKKHLSRLLDE